MLSIIIVNYHSAALIENCLRSVYQSTRAGFFEIIVIDNGSGEGDELKMQEQFPGVRWISMGYNAGFARANNTGIRESLGETVLLMNPDILVEENAIEACYKLFRQSSHVACGVQLLNPDRTPQISGNYFIRGGINHFLPLPFLGSCFKWLGNTLKVKKTNIREARNEVKVDWINGAFLMVKKSAIEKAGLLDEDFFLYAEEIEWCYRLGKTGSLAIYGNLHVVHLEGETAKAAFNSAQKGYFNLSDRKGRQIMLSNFVRIRKQFGIAWFLFHLGLYILEIPVFFTGLLLQKISGVKERYHFASFKGYCKNLGYVLTKAGKIIRNRPYFYKSL